MPTDTKADESAATATAIADATKKATADAQARIKAIMTNEEASGRETLAQHFAYETESTAEAAIAALKAAPKAAAGTSTTADTYEQNRVNASNLARPQNNAGSEAAKSLNVNDIWAKRRAGQKGA